MAVGASLDTLEILYNELVTSMNQVDTMITQVDSKLDQASAEWKGTGETQFREAWATGKTNLATLCQAFARSASDLAEQHNHFRYAAREQGASELNTNVVSPR